MFDKIKGLLFGKEERQVQKKEKEDVKEVVKDQPSTEKKKLKTVNPYVKIVRERTGRKTDEVLSDMKKARSDYGISFSDYEQFNGENCKTDEDFQNLKERIRKRAVQRRNKTISKLCEATGWSKKEAVAKLDYVKEKFGLLPRQYYAGGYFLLPDDEIEEAIKKSKERSQEIIKAVMDESGWSEDRVKRHMKYISRKYGVDNTDYRLIKAWRFSDKEMDKMACLKATRALTHKYNDPKVIKKLSNKLEFNKEFTDCIQRRFWTNDEESDLESFRKFWDGMDEAMYKPLTLFQARGIRKIKAPENMEEAYEELKSGPQVLLEEVVKQHSAVNEIYPNCVNTVRLVTLLKDDEFKVLCSFMKFGKDGSVVDNMAAGGMIAGVDEVNGVIETGAVDRDGNVHMVHPNTGKPIKGFKIPNFDDALRITEKATRKVEGINFVGWDVAICQDKAVIIEGNSLPGLMAYQLAYLQDPLCEPKLYKVEPYL